MPPPPPPPPGAPPPPAAVKKSATTGKVERKDLLKDIQRGKNLRPTQTNDRSAPVVGGKSSNAGTAHPVGAAGQTTGGVSGNGGAAVGPLPGIGGLFAGGMPTLKKTKGGVTTGRTNGKRSFREYWSVMLQSVKLYRRKVFRNRTSLYPDPV